MDGSVVDEVSRSDDTEELTHRDSKMIGSQDRSFSLDLQHRQQLAQTIEDILAAARRLESISPVEHNDVKPTRKAKRKGQSSIRRNDRNKHGFDLQVDSAVAGLRRIAAELLSQLD